MVRRNLDQYFTGEVLTAPLLDAVNICGKVLEPCSGEGHISAVLKTVGCEVVTNDIDESFAADYHMDATQEDTWTAIGLDHDLDWIVTNPPFKKAFSVLQNAMKLTDNVAILVRLSFLEPTRDRQEFLSANPPTDMIVLPRYSFTNDGKTDSVTCCWLAWRKSAAGTGTRMHFAQKHPRVASITDERPLAIIRQFGEEFGWVNVPKLLGATRQAAHLWKTGKRAPTAETILKAIDMLKEIGKEVE
jgi:hypothetical protein